MSTPFKVQVFLVANTWKEYFKLKFLELVVILQIIENQFMLNVQSTLLANILVIRKNKNNFVYMQLKTIDFLPVSWGWNRQSKRQKLRSINSSLFWICRWYVFRNRLQNAISQGGSTAEPFKNSLTTTDAELQNFSFDNRPPAPYVTFSWSLQISRKVKKCKLSKYFSRLVQNEIGE